MEEFFQIKPNKLKWYWHALLIVAYAIVMFLINEPHNDGLNPQSMVVLSGGIAAVYLWSRSSLHGVLENRWKMPWMLYRIALGYLCLYTLLCVCFLLLSRASLRLLYKEHLPFSFTALAGGTLLFYLRYAIYGILMAYTEAQVVKNLTAYVSREGALFRQWSKRVDELRRKRLLDRRRADVSHFLGNLLQDVHLSVHRGQAHTGAVWDRLVHYAVDALDDEETPLLTPLGTEIEMLHLLERYYADKYKFGVQIVVEGSVRGHKIPRMVLLMLMQDIFKHGSEAGPAPRLAIYLNREYMRIHVSSPPRSHARWQTGRDGKGLRRLRELLSMVYAECLLWDLKRDMLFELDMKIINRTNTKSIHYGKQSDDQGHGGR